LIAAINNANATPATEDTIDLPPGCLYELTAADNYTDGSNGLPSITSTIVINGNGSTIFRSYSPNTPPFRIFHVSNIGMLILNDLTLSNGLAFAATTGDTAHNAGGGIYTNNRISLYGVTIDGNHATLGGGVYNTIANGMTISETTFQNNGADINNSAGERGGAIYNLSSTTITKSTFVNNHATETGGAIENGSNGRLMISNSTFSGNSTSLLGGSAILNSGEITVMSYTTITNNTGGSPGAALLSGPDTVHIRNSIIASNTGGDCSYPPTITTLWENLDSDGTCTGFTITDNPDLEPLANNGGPTLTHALPYTSPAVDAADGNCLTIDQRGESRPQGIFCDLGAYELLGGGPTVVIPSSITGFVFIDTNGNGIRDVSEETTGVTGAHLTLMEGHCPGSNLISETWSNSPDGLYGFGMLMPGNYCILPDPLQQTILPVTREIALGNDEHLVDVNFYLPSPAAEPPPPASQRCDQFKDGEYSLVLLNIQAETFLLPLYVKMEGGFPDADNPKFAELWEFEGHLGIFESNSCGLQGFLDRVYCTFTLTPDTPGQVLDFVFSEKSCEDSILTQPRVTIPDLPPVEDPPPTCSKDLKQEACKAAGGKMSTGATTAPYCICP
jgi:predicted outer membrane repeat protein